MIVQDLQPYKDEAMEILYKVFVRYFPDQPKEWFISQISDSDVKLSLGYVQDGKLVAIYILKLEAFPFGNYPGIGLRGDALAVLHEYRGNHIFEKFLAYIKENYQVDYLWGTQAKVLNNIGFWMKYRVLVREDDAHYYTVQALK